MILTDTVSGRQFATRGGPETQTFSDFIDNGLGSIYAQAGAYNANFQDPPSSIVATQIVGTIPTDYSISVSHAIEFANVTNTNAIPYSLFGPNSNSYGSTFVESLTGTHPTPTQYAPGWEMGTPSSQLSYIGTKLK